jgi:hypothetical protein
MPGKKSSTILPHGLKKLSEKKTFVVAYISVRQLNDPWKGFKKSFIHSIAEAQGSNVEIDMLISRSYAKSLGTTGWAGYETLGLQSGYLYPTVPEVGVYRKIQLIEEGILAQNCVDVVYSSNKTSESGDSVKIKRLYVGKIYDYNRASNQITLRIDDTYRTFKIDEIATVDEFNVKTKAEVRHLKLDLEPLSNGSTKVTYTEIIGESDNLIAKPWDEVPVTPKVLPAVTAPAITPKPLSKAQVIQAPRDKPKPKRQFNHLQAETKLEALYNEFITVVEHVNDESVRTSLKLKGFRLYGGSDKALLHGEAGINLEVALANTEIIRKKNSESLQFRS